MAEEESTSRRSDQPLWPLGLLAVALASAGYGLAHRAPAPSFEGAPSFAVDASTATVEGDADVDDAVRLVYAGEGKRRIGVTFRVDDTTESPPLETRVDLGMVEQRTPRTDGGVELERTIEDVAVAVESGEESIGSSIVGQVESLLLGTRETVAVDAIGRVDDFEWTTVTNPQVRQTLRMLKHARVLATPRFRRGAINVGESWSYEFVPEVPVGDAIRSMEGKTEVEATLVGVRRRDECRCAVVERSFDISADGSVEPDRGDEYGFELSAEGEGRALFDVDRGMLVESRVDLSRRLRILEGPDRRSMRRGRLKIVVRDRGTQTTGDDE